MKPSIMFISIFKCSPIFPLLSFPLIVSCSGSTYCTDEEKLGLEYYSQGGVTGGSSGISIDSTGTANFWNQNLNAERIITKTIKLKSENLNEICKLLEKPEVFTYKNNFTGNYTTYLIIKSGVKENKISFNKSDLPLDMPIVVKQLIKLLNNIE